jgi:eukaryotic-like serine/threonine-protein kinase
MSEALPQLIADRYRLVEPLGQGGMGRVWRARDEVLHRDVAIKELVPPPGLTTDERREMRERSLREARAIARLNNINVVRVFDVLRTDADPWIVMEYVRSRSLQDALAADGPVPPGRAAEIGLGVLGALKAAHKAGVMHRDVKPGNVLLGEDGRVVLTDFGLATVPGDPNVTRTGLVLGSPAYIAPERARDGTAGPEADLWSLGATLYAAVEGQSPYARSSAIATLAALATEPPPPAKRAGPLKAVLNGLLRKDPTQRITAEVAERLLRRASDKRPRGAISLLDGVRRPSPYGPREVRTKIVPLPAQRLPQDKPVKPTEPVEAVTSDTAAAVDQPPAADPDDVAGTAGPAANAVDLEPVADSSSPTELAGQVDPPAPVEDRTAKLGEGVPVPPSSDASAAVPAPPVVPNAPTLVEPALVAAGPTEVVAGVARGRTFGPFRPRPAGAGTDRKGSFLTAQRVWLIGGLVALLLLALVVVVPLATRNSDDKQSAQPGGGPTSQPMGATTAPAAPPPTAAPTTAPTGVASPSAAPPGGSALPPGWILHKDPTGFSVPMPSGWRVQRNKTSVEFNEPSGARTLMIDQTDSPKSDAVADWTKQESDRLRAGRYRDYSRVKIASVDYFLEAADWEWTYTSSNGNRLHVLNRGFVTGPKHGYAIYWSTPASAWNDNLDELKIITEGFQPAPN